MLFKLLLLLLAGAIINVAVAWGCAIAWDFEDTNGISITEMLGDGAGWFEMKAGVPLRCLRGIRSSHRRWDNVSDRAINHTTTTGFLEIARRTGGSEVIVPVSPIWPGFAINTIFYAAVLWVLFAVPGRVRRWRRIKRGQCASCGYSLRENVSEKCPECGASA